ncbi:MAG TPA: maleylpyruvate isomerase N-terminal domain-containing protein [Candidatus Dormibacteraeota bacterium]|nr:maleylpyruvate isomerase N-terminal domain-containing protein [Candidatus Dormibacteraeota bacterium]
MSIDDPDAAARSTPPPADHPYAAEIEAERRGWYELAALVRSLTPEECLVPGYYPEPGWTVRDLVAHLGTWLAEAEIQLERLSAGTYAGHDVDIDGLNTAFLAAMGDQPWTVAWTQANAGRTRMLQEWYALREPTDEAAWWVRKSAADHYVEHLDRLRTWVQELIRRRSARSALHPPDAGRSATRDPEARR